ncbi:MAG: hypothetical protein ACOC44_08355 [Promethearchaeia archaeon]
MVTISVRISPELKKKMEKFKQINWSEIMRSAIKREIKSHTKSNRAKAVLINEKIRKKAPENFNSANIIRHFREERH